VIAQYTSTRYAHLGFNGTGKFGLGHPLAPCLLRCDTGDQARHRMWQGIIRGLAEQLHRLTDLIEIGISANGSELRRTITARVSPECLVIVPQESQRSGGRLRHGQEVSTRLKRQNQKAKR